MTSTDNPFQQCKRKLNRTDLLNLAGQFGIIDYLEGDEDDAWKSLTDEMKHRPEEFLISFLLKYKNLIVKNYDARYASKVSQGLSALEQYTKDACKYRKQGDIEMALHLEAIRDQYLLQAQEEGYFLLANEIVINAEDCW